MKRFLNAYLSMTLIASLFVVAGCKDDEPSVNGLGIAFDKVNGSEAALNIGEDINFDVNVSAPAGFSKLIVYKTIGTSATSQLILEEGADSGTHPTSFSYPFSYTPTKDVKGETVTFEFRAFDKGNHEASSKFLVRVSDQEFAEFKTILLGGQNNVYEASFYNSIRNKKLLYQSALSNPEKVDFVYHYGSSSGFNIIASPDDADSRKAWESYGNPLTGMNNATRFKKVTTTTFGALGTKDAIINAFVENQNPELSRVTELQKGETFAFRLDDSRGARYGVAEVAEVLPADADRTERSITLNVKVQFEDN